jgi:hypothetical protein
LVAYKVLASGPGRYVRVGKLRLHFNAIRQSCLITINGTEKWQINVSIAQQRKWRVVVSVYISKRDIMHQDIMNIEEV